MVNMDEDLSLNRSSFTKLIALMGMPRSGTSWISQIFDSSPDTRFRLSPLFSYQYKNYLNESSTREEWLYVLQGSYESENEFMNQTERRRNKQYPDYFKKKDNPEILVIKDTRFHNLAHRILKLLSDAKIIVIVRNPCAMLYSWSNAPREFPAGADLMKEWRSGNCRKTGYGEFWGFQDWKETTLMYLEMERREPDRCRIIRYENLVDDPVGVTRHLFNFCGLEFTLATEKFLQDCHQRHDPSEYAVFKDPSVKDAWKGNLPYTIEQEIERELAGTELEFFLK